MNEISFIKMLRDMLSTAEVQCNVQEYKPEYIIKNFNTKLSNLQKSIESSDLNRKQKLKYSKVLNNCKLQYINPKHYEIMSNDFRNKIRELPSVLDLIKK